jgi:tetratricopeptide (TPR) repeat protein
VTEAQVIGQFVGPYAVLEQLGSGGMGDVYLARDTRLGRKVALKKPSEAWLSLPDARRRLHREASAAGGLTHPNIAAIYDVLDVGPDPYIVMEYVEGESLAHIIRRGSVSIERALDLGIQIADALATAHAKGVVHRDLKPANVSVTPDGRAKVLDFGLAKARGPIAEESSSPTAPSPLTMPGQILGTPGYASPEQLTGAPADPRDDVYSLGVLLFEMVTGRRPFQASDAMGLALATLTQPPPAAKDANGGVPDDVSAVIAKAMARDRQQRFTSAVEIRSALQRVAHGLAAGPTGGMAFAPPRRRRPLARRLAVVLSVILLAGAAAFFTVRALRSRPAPTAATSGNVPVVAVLPFSNKSDRAGDDSIAAGMRDVLVANLGGFPGANVLSRTRADDPEWDVRDLRRLARDLGATHLLTGTLQRARGELNVSVQLIEGKTGFVAWGGNFSGSEDSLFTLQERISDGISAAPPFVVGDTAAQRGQSTSGTDDVQALELYGQAVSLLERPDVPGNIGRAEKLLESALARDRKFALAWARLGEAYWARYKEKSEPSWAAEAADAINEALRLEPDHARVRISLALVHHGTGRNDTAIEELNHALRLQPNSDDAHRLLGQVLQGMDRNEEAIEHYRKAIELRPNYWHNYNVIGGLYYATGRQEDAIQAFTRVTELQPDNARGFHNLGTLYYTLGNNDKALANYEKAIALAPIPDTYSNVGTIHYDQGRYRQAVESYQRAIEIAPGDGVLRGNLGDAQTRLGRRADARQSYAEAIRLTRRALTVNPNDAIPLARLAVWQMKLNQRAAATQSIERALELNADDAEVQYRAAVVHALDRDTKAALGALERAIKSGYSAALAARDHDLASIRNTARFRELVRQD